MNGKRAQAWRNLMVAAIDVALERGLLDLDPGAEVEACVYTFKLDGFPTLAAISDSGYGEVAVRVACYRPSAAPSWCGASAPGSGPCRAPWQRRGRPAHAGMVQH